MNDVSRFLNEPNLPTSFAALLRKRPVVYAPAIATGTAEAKPFATSRAESLRPFHQAQPSMTTCSATTACAVFSAMRALHSLPPVTVQDVLDADSSGDWKSSVSGPSCRGVSLGHLAELLIRAAPNLLPSPVTVTSQPVSSTDSATLRAVRARLEEFERSPRHFLIANFNQASYLQDGFDVGHMSVVGGFDIQQDHVLVMDVEVRGLLPYWIPFGVFVRGLHTYDADAKGFRGLITLATLS